MTLFARHQSSIFPKSPPNRSIFRESVIAPQIARSFASILPALAA